MKTTVDHCPGLAACANNALLMTDAFSSIDLLDEDLRLDNLDTFVTDDDLLCDMPDRRQDLLDQGRIQELTLLALAAQRVRNCPTSNNCPLAAFVREYS
jgi:hypothetical protein